MQRFIQLLVAIVALSRVTECLAIGSMKDVLPAVVEPWTRSQVRIADERVSLLIDSRLAELRSWVWANRLRRIGCPIHLLHVPPHPEHRYLAEGLDEVVINAFAACSSVRLEVVDQSVDLREYPLGFALDYVYRGALIVERYRVTENSDMRFVFDSILVAGGTRTLGEDIVHFGHETVSEEEFRRIVVFRPTLRIVFEGDGCLSIDVDTRSGDIVATRRTLWAPYRGEPRPFEILRELSSMLGREGAEPGATDNPDDAQRLREDH